jgi:hypothetical protein
VVGEERALGEVLGELARLLRDATAPDLEELRALARVLPQLVAGAELNGEGLRALPATLGLAHENALLRLLGARATPEAWDRLRSDLKAALLAARSALERRGAHHAEPGAQISKALAGLEAEQLLNLARAKAGESELWSFPIADADGWSTARLRFPPRRERSQDEGQVEAPALRLALGLELTHLGALRADFVFHHDHLALRLAVVEPGALASLQAALPALRERLSGLERPVEISLCACTREEAELAHLPLDIRYLREHHLMNVEG